jgi:hypothetical protein
MGKADSEELVLYGFHRSTYVSVARLVMHARGVPFQFTTSKTTSVRRRTCAGIRSAACRH